MVDPTRELDAQGAGHGANGCGGGGKRQDLTPDFPQLQPAHRAALWGESARGTRAAMPVHHPPFTRQ